MHVMFIVGKPVIKHVGAVPWLKLSMVCLSRHMLSPGSVCIGFLLNRVTHTGTAFLNKNFGFFNICGSEHHAL